MITNEEYKAKVIELFKAGRPTDEQWNEMADAVLVAAETDSEYSTISCITLTIEPDLD